MSEIFELYFMIGTFERRPNYFWEDLCGEEEKIKISFAGPGKQIKWIYRFSVTAKLGELLGIVIYRILDFDKVGETLKWNCYIKPPNKNNEAISIIAPNHDAPTFTVNMDAYSINRTCIIMLEEKEDEMKELIKLTHEEDTERENEEDNKKLKRRRE